MWQILTFLLLVKAFSSETQSTESEQSVCSLFKSLGYSHVRVASALASCEHSAKKDVMCENKDTPKNSYLEYFDLLFRLDNLTTPSENNLQNITNSIAEQQEFNLKLANRFCAFENIILKENTLIRDELNFLKEKWNKDTSQEETKTNIEELKTLINDVKNTLISVHRIPQHCAETSLPVIPYGVTTVNPHEENVSKPFLVLCDQTTDGGGWTVIQNRDSAAIRQDFNRSWTDYVEGFGDVKGEFWLGLDNIHALTELTPMELRIDLEDYDGVKKGAKYDSFKIGDASTKYVLTLGEYSGDAGDALTEWHNGMKFSTYDQDNDKDSRNCAQGYRGGWWFNYCRSSHLNGYQHVGKYSSNSLNDGIVWYLFRGIDYSLKKASMKIRPKN